MGKAKSPMWSVMATVASILCFLTVAGSRARAQEAPVQTPSPAAPRKVESASPPARGAIALTVRYGDAEKGVPVARKHFFLSPRPFNIAEIQKRVGRLPSRREYYRRLMAADKSVTPDFIEWLEKNNCETIYCREIRDEDLRVKVFGDAYVEAMREFSSIKDKSDRSREALKWLTNFISPRIRTGYYEEKMRWLRCAVKEAAREGGIDPESIKAMMTDRNGVAVFTDLEIGEYFISNLAPVELDNTSLLWATERVEGVEKGKPKIRKQIRVKPVADEKWTDVELVTGSDKGRSTFKNLPLPGADPSTPLHVDCEQKQTSP